MTVVKLRPMDAADDVLSEAVGDFSEVMLLGYDHEGRLTVRMSKEFENASAVFLLLKRVDLEFSRMLEIGK